MSVSFVLRERDDIVAWRCLCGGFGFFRNGDVDVGRGVFERKDGPDGEVHFCFVTSEDERHPDHTLVDVFVEEGFDGHLLEVVLQDQDGCFRVAEMCSLGLWVCCVDTQGYLVRTCCLRAKACHLAENVIDGLVCVCAKDGGVVDSFGCVVL